MFQASQVAGPALAGFVIAGLGVGGAYLLNAISFFAVIGALLLMHTSGEIEGASAPVSLKAMWEGLVFVKSKVMIWSTMLLDFFSTFFASATALLPIYAHSILHVGPVGYGFLYSAQAIGAVLAGFLIAHAGTIKKQGRVLLIAVSVYGLATIVFAYSTLFALSFFALFMVGVGDSVSSIIRTVIRNLVTPDYIRGRMTSVNMIFYVGGPQLGEFEAGLLASAVGGPLSVAIGGLGTLIVVGIIAVTIPQIRTYSHEASSGT